MLGVYSGDDTNFHLTNTGDPSRSTRVVKASLLQSAGVAQVYTDPFPADSVRDYDVAIEVSRCEGSASRSGSYAARFTATIEVSTAGPKSPCRRPEALRGPGRGLGRRKLRPAGLAPVIRRGRPWPGGRLGNLLPKLGLPERGGDPIQGPLDVLAAVEGADPDVAFAAPSEARPGVQTTWARSSSRSKNVQESRPTLTHM